MSSDDYDDEEFYEEEEEWEYVEEVERESFRDRVAIKDILKLVALFIAFVGFFFYFRYWDSLVGFMTFGSESLEFGQSRMLLITLLLLPFALGVFIVGLVKVSRTLFIPRKESATED